MSNDTNFGVLPVSAAEVPVVEPVRSTNVTGVSANRFDRLVQTGSGKPRSVGAQSMRDTRIGMRRADADAEWFDKSLHMLPANQAQTAAKAAPTQQQTDAAAEAERLMLGVLIQGNTLAQQTSAVPTVAEHVGARRYTDIVAASNAAAIAALRASPDDDGQDAQERQEEQQEERKLLPGIGLATRAAKKEWLRCVTSAPRPMRPTPHLPKLG